MTFPTRQDDWAERLRISFDGPALDTDLAGGGPDDIIGLDDLIAKVIADIDLHVTAASTTRSRARALHAEATAALRAAGGTDTAQTRAGDATVSGQRSPGQTLDVRR